MNPSSFVNDLTNKIVNYKDSDLFTYLLLSFRYNRIVCEKCGYNGSRTHRTGNDALENNWIFTLCQGVYPSAFCSQECYSKVHQRSYNSCERFGCTIVVIPTE